MIPLAARLSGTTGSARESQNGMKYRTVCRSCNAHLGQQYDPTVAAFARDVAGYVTASILLPRSIEVPVQVQRLMKGVLGHLLAAEVDYRSSFFHPWAKDYVLDPAAPLPAQVNIFFWLHQGPGSVAVTDLVKFSLRDHSAHHLHLLKFRPLGFLVTASRMYGGLPSLSRHRAARSDDVVGVRVPLRARRPEDWPEAPSDDDDTVSLLGGAAANAIYARTLTYKIK